MFARKFFHIPDRLTLPDAEVEQKVALLADGWEQEFLKILADGMEYSEEQKGKVNERFINFHLLDVLNVNDYPARPNLIKALKELYIRLKDMQADERKGILTKLDDIILPACTARLHGDVNEILRGFFTPRNFEEVLYKVREGVVDRFLVKYGINNPIQQYFIYGLAQSNLNFGVIPKGSANEGFGLDRDFYLKKLNATIKHISAFNVCDLIKEALIHHGLASMGYVGYSSNEFGYSQSEFEEFYRFLKRIFPSAFTMPN